MKPVILYSRWLFLLTSLTVCGASSANGGIPDYRIMNAVQGGQDVDLELGFHAYLHDFSFSLIREGDGYRKVLFENEHIVESGVSATHCWEWPSCNPDAETCYDCNGDGEDECPTQVECVDIFKVAYNDYCVYPGETKYIIQRGSVKTGEDTDVNNEFTDIIDTEESCDYDIDWGGDDGCSVTGPGWRPLSVIGTLMLMLSVGLLALRRRRKR
jgi:MYXO-CTERM domain-containing protein